MSQPTPFNPPFSFTSELGTTFGAHLDTTFTDIQTTTDEILESLAQIQRDDFALRNGSVTPDSLSAETVTLIAGATQNPDIEWRPMGDWVTATSYEVGNLVEQTSVVYACVVAHVSGVFAVDLAAGKWMLLTAVPTLVSSDITTALGYTPVNRAGDTMTGALTIPTGSKILGASGITWTDTYLAQDLATVNKGIYSVYSTTAADIAYGFASNVVRTSGAFLAVGGQFSALGTSAAGATMFGGNANAIGLSGFAQPLVGWEVDVANFTPNNTSMKFGVDLVFVNRHTVGSGAGNYSFTFPQGTFSSVGGGLGNNRYNYRTRAINVSSQAGSVTGEFCGWTRGLFFNEFSMDSENDASYPGSRAYPIGIDFSEMHYYGGSDPVSAFNLEAGIAFRDLQGIWWNRDPSTAASSPAKVKSHFNPFTSRWVIENTGIERFGIDVVTGVIYSNGSPITSGVTLSGNNTWTGTNTFNAAVAIGANLTFTGSARRISGDFTNATLANRTMFQTSTVNGATELTALPNGASTASAYNAINSSGAATGAVLRMAIDSANAAIEVATFGAGTLIPLRFTVGSEAMRIDTSAAVLINTTSSPTNGAKLRVNGLVQIDNTASFSVHNNNTSFTAADNTVVQVPFSTESFDVGGYFDLGTDRFTPPAGKYHLMGAVRTNLAGVVGGVLVSLIYKNGVQEKSGCFSTEAAAGISFGSCVSCVVDANGTDFFDFRVLQDNSTATTLTMSGLASDTYFQGFRIG